ncbi:ROK family protein [Chondromyces crocatus]|uniref:ROK family transcriptional regulator n=1 Tax=Chondromyces crocatus TaxID=52 RepID=A0A0K1E834_CHOCO|nr:ROK family protein [Chondromyces crocatus]AKT37041.1 ROK family transcriptional regulator [Chondromyces crocatus]
MRTLCIDVGGSGIKGIVVDATGGPLTERLRLPTPRPATPEAVLRVLSDVIKSQGDFERVSIGFPGVVVDGVIHTAFNLDHAAWSGFPLGQEVAKRVGRPVRVANDADIQGLDVIQGQGLEMLITLGTGMGAALYIEGKLVPNLELGHHPFRKGKTYEERVCNAERKRIGHARWNKRVRQVIAQLEPIFNYRRLYVGGGNARHVDPDGLPEHVVVIDNMAGLLGGTKLWD